MGEVISMFLTAYWPLLMPTKIRKFLKNVAIVNVANFDQPLKLINLIRAIQNNVLQDTGYVVSGGYEYVPKYVKPVKFDSSADGNEYLPKM